jgi:hypothetical protein
VLEVRHDRLAARLDVDEVEVVLQIDTRGPEHCGEVIGPLRAAGYTLAFAWATDRRRLTRAICYLTRVRSRTNVSVQTVLTPATVPVKY